MVAAPDDREHVVGGWQFVVSSLNDRRCSTHAILRPEGPDCMADGLDRVLPDGIWDELIDMFRDGELNRPRILMVAQGHVGRYWIETAD